jgi:acetolactate synthase-1/2/3 large subunit
MYLVDALARSDKDGVVALHEQGAGFMAIADAQINGFAVCLTTSGPGATNAITPCAAAWTDSVNVLFISGQATSNSLVGDTGLRTRGIQEVDIIPVVQPITVARCRPQTVKEAQGFIDFVLLRIHTNTRPGSYWLDLPLDLQGALCDQ